LQQNMINTGAQLPPAGQGRQFAMQQAQHPQIGGINPHPQMGGMQPTGRGSFNPRPPMGGPQPTGRGGGINPNPQMGGPQPTGRGGGINLNGGITGYGPNGEPIYSQQDQFGHQIMATGPSNGPQPTGSGGGINPQPQDQLPQVYKETLGYAPQAQITYPTTYDGGVSPQPPIKNVVQPEIQPTGYPSPDGKIYPPEPEPTPFPSQDRFGPNGEIYPIGYNKPLNDPTTPQYAAGGVTKKLPTAKQMGAMALAKGGRVKETMGSRSMKEDVEHGSNRHLKHGESAVQKKGHTKGKNLGDSGKTVGIERGPKHFAKGGHVKSIDGIARRGHTKVKYR
jgi:hypothetical protein